MRKAFQFQVGWRTYRCAVGEQPRSPNGAPWWWFFVTGDGHRYSPFPAAAGDTEESVRERILAFHTHRLARRAEPPPPRYQVGRPPKAKAPPPPAKK